MYAQNEHLTGSVCAAARALLDWTQADLSVRSGVARRTISLFESGAREPFDRTKRDLIEAFAREGVTLDVNHTGLSLHLKYGIHGTHNTPSN